MRPNRQRNCKGARAFSMMRTVSSEHRQISARWGLLLLAATALLVLLPGNDRLPLIDRDEPRFAQAAREMIDRGEWVVPYFNHEYRFDKPILIYWMMRVSYAAFGVNEFAARLPSALCALGVACAVFLIGRRWFSSGAGFAAAFGWLTCLQVLIHGRSAAADMPMVLAVVLAQYAAFELLHSDRPRYPWGLFWLLYGALGLGFLAKGPVAQIVPLLTLVLHRFLLWRKPLPWRRLRLGLGLPVMLAIMGAWGIPALLRTHGEFWTVGMHAHVFKRGWSSFNGHASFFLYYLVMSLVSLFPWIAFAGDGLGAARRRWSEKNAFLVSWLLGTYLLFSFYSTKLPHYVMPAFPAFFLVLGQASEERLTRAWPARAWFALVLFLPAALAAAVMARAVPAVLPPAFAGARGALMGGSGLVLALAALALLWRLGAARYSAVPLLGVAACVVVLGTGLRELSPAVGLARLAADMPADAEFGFYKFKEPSLVFYTNRRWETLSRPEDLAAFLAKPGPRMAVAPLRETRAQDLLKWSPGTDYSEETAGLEGPGCSAATLEGINIARSSVVRLRVFRKP